MTNRPVWVAFLLVCFLLTGLVGLFASYGPSIPLQRALYLIETLDRTGAVPPGDRQDAPLPADPRAARLALIERGQRESDLVATRTRLMVGIVTVLAAGLGAGLLLLASRQKS